MESTGGSLPNGTQTNYGYDGLQRLTQMQTVAGAANISNYAYAYDNTTHRPVRTSEVSQIAAEGPITRAYGYDAVDQLTGETVSQNGQTVSQSTSAYDPMGNRTGAQSTSATSQSTSSYTSNKLNQLIALSTTTGTDTTQSTLGYDLSGNLTSLSSGTSGTSYSYDDANRLSAVEVPGQSKSTFLYDGLSRLRVSRDFAWQNGAWVQTGEVRRVYDGMDVVQERDASNVPICTYTRSGNIGGILARTDGNGHLFYHYDGRGNVSQLTDASAQVAARYSYDAFGNTSASGTAANLNRYRFSTKEDIGGLYSYGYRFYAPGLGRWINRDPISEQGDINLYRGVGNDPINLHDPYGLNIPGGPYGLSPTPEDWMRLPGDIFKIIARPGRVELGNCKPSCRASFLPEDDWGSGYLPIPPGGTSADGVAFPTGDPNDDGRRKIPNGCTLVLECDKSGKTVTGYKSLCSTFGKIAGGIRPPTPEDKYPPSPYPKPKR